MLGLYMAYENTGPSDVHVSHWPGKSTPGERKITFFSRAFQSVRNVLGEDDNLIIVSPGEGQETIIK